jgi:hypothetical protein
MSGCGSLADSGGNETTRHDGLYTIGFKPAVMGQVKKGAQPDRPAQSRWTIKALP